MKNNFVFLLFFLAFGVVAQSQDFSGVMALTKRVAPWTKNKIVFHAITNSETDRFELLTQDKKLHIWATSASAAAMGFNYYLNHFCNQSVAHGSENLKSLSQMPEVKEKRIITTDFQYRFALNYCTYNYSMSFYQWKDWEKELDWMSLQGVNLMLAVNGTEIIWQKTLEEFGFSDGEIKKFIPGPAYTAWWLMGNLEGWGGTVTDAMINRQMELQKKMLSRMKELGIEPVLHGFYGMVPSTLSSKYPSAKIVDQGKWAGNFQRPAILSPQDSLFGKMAKVYYQNIKDIYGDFKFFGGDPFHEGGSSKGLDVSLSAKNIQSQMQTHFPNSIWVLQGWGGNPSKELLKDLEKDKVLVLDLFGENKNNWETSNAYNETPWLWCSVNNFGENTGMYGKLQRLIDEPRRAQKTPQGKFMKGIGIMPEGILNNPLLYHLTLKSAWGTKSETDSLLLDYQKYRYGKENADLYQGLLLLEKSVYISHKASQEGCTESLFAARPAKVINSVSTWGTRKLFYENQTLKEALQLFLNASDSFKHKESYQYDITDIARQVVANQGQMAFDSLMKSFGQKNIIQYNRHKKGFLQLIHFQEKLMATNKNFMAGPWLQQAKDFGKTTYEKQLSERNARLQITIWGPDTNAATNLHEYAHKEWSGLIKDLYLPRWELFFEQLDNELAGKAFKEVDYFAMELKWVNQQNNYTIKAKGDYLNIIKEIVRYCEK